MPLVTKIGVYVIKPFGIGIFDAITISYAIFISSFITVLIYAFFQLFKKTYSFWIANFTSIIFVYSGSIKRGIAICYGRGMHVHIIIMLFQIF